MGSLLGVAGCTPTADDGTAVLKVTYIKTDAFTALDTLFTHVKAEFEAAHEGVTVELLPVAGTDSDYTTKLALSHRSPETAPDVFYEDTMALRADVDAGFLLNLDSHVAGWDDWAQFDDSAKAAGAGDDGSIYAVSLGTDTRAIWYRTSVFEAAGIAALVSTCLDATRRRGTTVVVGVDVSMAATEFLPVLLATQGKRIVGTLLGDCHPQRDIPMLLAAWRSGRLDLESMISHRLDLSEVNEGLDRLRRADGIRTVLEVCGS